MGWFFNKLLNKKGNEDCPKPLWKLKITDQEFNELRELLAQRNRTINVENPFDSVREECTLFFAEYWRRLYDGGTHDIDRVYDFIVTTKSHRNHRNQFYEAAKSGAESLKIERYQGGRNQILEDMLYQGGLPMKKLISNADETAGWYRFVKGLVNRGINFDYLIQKGTLSNNASKSNSLREFCYVLIEAIEQGDYAKMPFYCPNENNSWFKYLINLAQQERTYYRELHPFSFSWVFDIDSIYKQIKVKYHFNGQQCLQKRFLQERGLANLKFFSIQVRNNNKVVDTFDYDKSGFCRYSVKSEHNYSDGDYISLFLHDDTNPYLEESLDLTVPHILYKKKECEYVLGNKIGFHESLLLIPDGWDILNATETEIIDYSWGKTNLKGVHIPSNYNNEIKLKGKDGVITFGREKPLYWTEMKSTSLYDPNICEPIYNASKCVFSLCNDKENGSVSKEVTHNVEYRNKWQDEWSSEPCFGEIFARAIDRKGNYVTPIRLVNVGEGLSVSIEYADNETCRIRITWPHGSVSTKEGQKKGDDCWEIKKQGQGRKDPHKICFLLTPEENPRNQFSLSVKAPFKGFSILDKEGNELEQNSLIPYIDINSYQYHIVGNIVSSYSFGNIIKNLQWVDNKLCIYEGDRFIKNIPYEGSLLTLLDSREVLLSLLERTSQTILEAKIDVRFSLTDGKRQCFTIKKFPFRAHQENGKIKITDGNRDINYQKKLILFKLYDPTWQTELKYNEEQGGYLLSDSLRSCGELILAGKARGRVLPKEMNPDERAASVKDEISRAKLGDKSWERIIGWFNNCHKNNIPASSILELDYTSKSCESLICLAFQLYVACKDTYDEDTLQKNLISFSEDLAFQWYWIQPCLDKILCILNKYIGENSSFTSDVKKCAQRHDGDIGEDFFDCCGKCIDTFTEWIKELCVSSMIETYDDSSQELEMLARGIIENSVVNIENDEEYYVDNNQDFLENEVRDFFLHYNEPNNRSPNEQWLYSRVKAVVAHLKGEINLFNDDLFNDDQERNKWEMIRRSIIFCSKSYNQYFVTELNNKLYNRLYNRR